MAFLVRRWPWCLALAALAILVAYLPAQPPAEPRPGYGEWQSYPTRESRLAKRLGDAYLRAADRAAVISLRDSLLRVMAARAPRLGTVTSLSPRRGLDSVARLITRAATPPVPMLSPDVRGAFALVLSTPALWGASSNTYLPAATDGHTCLSTRSVGPTGKLESMHPRQALGPCAYFLAFGLPGREIGRWLESRNYDFALDPNWIVPPRASVPTERLGALEWLQVMLARVGVIAPTSQFWSAAEFQSLYWGSFTGSACAAGDHRACRRYFFSSAPDTRERWGRIPGVIGNRHYWWLSASNGVMATLVREQGIDRFARFWRSPLPPDRAFDQAFSVPFDQWAPTWARSTYGSVRIDVVTRPREVMSSILWIGLCVGACVGLALTRRVA